MTAGSGENCGTSTWDYAYDLMGNRISEIRRNAKGTVVENNHYVYNDSNQLVQAKLCDGKKTVCKKYTYDADGNLTEECSPDDPGLKRTYEYTVENRLAAVYDAHKLLMAAAYDGDGNRVFMLNYNPDKDEDFTDYYNSYQNKDYTGTGVLFSVCEEVGEAEQELLDLIKGQENVKYELIEYLTDVNREYAQVLVEQNLNGKTDATYTYGVDRISKELFDCESNTSYYLYDPRGSVTGLTNWKGQLCKTYQYDSYGQLTRGKEQYENAYTYNGESYNPNIDTLYLRARYYSVVTANFLTEDSYLGRINEPLTLNRYGYCLASPLNYVDPSGHSSDFIDYQELSSALMDLIGELTGDETYHGLAKVTRENKERQDYMDRSTSTGFMASIVKQLAVSPLIMIEELLYQTDDIGRAYDNYIDKKVSNAVDRNLYYAGRCAGDLTGGVIGIFLSAKGLEKLAGMLGGLFKNLPGAVRMVTPDGQVFSFSFAAESAIAGSTAVGVGLEGWKAQITFISDFSNHSSKIDWDELIKGEAETGNKITKSEHAEIRGSQGRNVNTAINDLNKTKPSNIYLQDDGRYVIKGANGRVHIMEPDGEIVTTMNNVTNFDNRVSSGRYMPLTEVQKADFAQKFGSYLNNAWSSYK